MDLTYPEDKPEGHVRFVCISDTHSYDDCYKNLPDGDVLIHAGDFTDWGSLEELQKFKENMKKLKYQYKVVIPGNHDLSLDKKWWEEGTKDEFFEKWEGKRCEKINHELAKEIVESSCTHYLLDSSCEILGYKVWGSPYQTNWDDYGFFKARGEQSKKVWDTIPLETDIVITHGPPLGIGDVNQVDFREFDRTGCLDLTNAIQRIKPLYHVFGHNHGDYGMSTDGTTKYINAASVDNLVTPAHKAIVFDLPCK